MVKYYISPHANYIGVLEPDSWVDGTWVSTIYPFDLPYAGGISLDEAPAAWEPGEVIDFCAEQVNWQEAEYDLICALDHLDPWEDENDE